jgi:phosphatidylinositol alpha-1,6-mannosyltransferase
VAPVGERPRLLVVSPDFPPASGGIQHVIHRLVQLMPAFETRVVTRPSPGADEWDRASGLDVRRAVLPFGSRKAGLVTLNLSAVGELRRFRPHVLLAGHIWAGPVARVARAVDVQSALYLHADEVPAHPRLTNLAAQACALTIAVSRHTRELALACGAPPERVHVIPPGVDVTDPGPTTTLRDERPTIVTVARLEDRYKGHDVMLRALPAVRERVPDVRWVVIGEGTLRKELEALTLELGVEDCVDFLGAVSKDERDHWLRRARVFAMPSRLPRSGGGEGFGIAYMEAAAHGLPVVAGSVGGALDAVEDGQTGLLVDPEDEGSVADALVRLLADPELATRLGEAGAARALDFAWPRIARRVEGLLLGVARDGGARGNLKQPALN